MKPFVYAEFHGIVQMLEVENIASLRSATKPAGDTSVKVMCLGLGVSIHMMGLGATQVLHALKIMNIA